MTPIEQVKPPTPGNWVRRPEGRLKRGGREAGRETGKERRPPDGNPGTHSPGPGPSPDNREHVIDELA